MQAREWGGVAVSIREANEARCTTHYGKVGRDIVEGAASQALGDGTSPG